MAVPRHKHTRASVGQRRMHIFITPAVLATCPTCGKPVRPHTMCNHCGSYNGKKVKDVMAKLSKKEKKTREKEMEATKKANEKQ